MGDDTRMRKSIEAYIAAWNEHDAGRRMQLIEQSCTDKIRLRTPGQRIDDRAQLDALIVGFQKRLPDVRAVLSSPIDIQGNLFRYSGIVEGSTAGPGDAFDAGECDEDGQICVLFTFVGATLPARR